MDADLNIETIKQQLIDCIDWHLLQSECRLLLTTFLNKLNGHSNKHYHHYLTTRSKQAPGDKSQTTVCGILGPHWCKTGRT